MLNIPELEKRWLHYKVKSYIPYFIITVSIVVIVSILLSFISTASSQSTPETTTIEVIEPIAIAPVEIQTPPRQERIVQIPTEQKESTLLKPSFDFMKKMQHATQPYYNNNQMQKSTVDTTPALSNKIINKKPVVKEKIIENKVTTVEEPTTKVSIKRQNTQNDIYEIIKRFKSNKNPALSLFVAKKYYELEDYQQSYNYALITNNLNKEIESSWLIFAKSLVKLGKKDMAIKTLEEYIKHSRSSNATMLLNDINSGKFR